MKPVKKGKNQDVLIEYTCWKCDNVWKDVDMKGKVYLCPRCGSHKITRRA